MSRNRLIYNSLAVFASQTSNLNTNQTGSLDIRELNRIQSFNFDYNKNLENVNELGLLSPKSRIEINNPNININLSYFLTDGLNEHLINLYVYNPIENIIEKHFLNNVITNNNEQNYYLLVSEEGIDAHNYYNGKTGIIGIGNTCLTSYSINASVGSIPTVDIELNGLNMAYYKNVSGINFLPSINLDNETGIYFFKINKPNEIYCSNEISALKPGDIKFTMTGALGYDNVDLKVQDFSLSFNLDRTPLKKVGKQYPFVRELNFPIIAQLEITADVGDLQTNNLSDLICGKSDYNFNIIFNKPGCKNFEPSIVYDIKSAKLISQNFTSNIGSNSTMNAVYEIDISDINNLNKGLFVSGNICQGINSNYKYTNVASPPSGFDNGFDYFAWSNDLNYDGSIIAVVDPTITLINENEGCIYIFTGDINSGWTQKQFISGNTFRGVLGDRGLMLNSSGNLLCALESQFFGGTCGGPLNYKALFYTGSKNNEWVLKQSFCIWSNLILSDNGSIFFVPSGIQSFQTQAIQVYTGDIYNGWTKSSKSFIRSYPGGSTTNYYDIVTNKNGNIITFIAEADSIFNNYPKNIQIYIAQDNPLTWTLKQSISLPGTVYSQRGSTYPLYISDNADLLFMYSGVSSNDGYLNLYTGSYNSEYVLFQSIPSIPIATISSNYDNSFFTVNYFETPPEGHPAFITYKGDIRNKWCKNKEFFYKEDNSILFFYYPNISHVSDDGNILTAGSRGSISGYIDIYKNDKYVKSC